MNPKHTHSWNLSVENAKQLQSDWSQKVVRKDIATSIRLVAGVDVAYSQATNTVIAGVTLLSCDDLVMVEHAIAIEEVSFPYLPGMFSFRELPSVVTALDKLTLIPDLIVCDGQGIAHPRRFGLASHLGVMFDVPTIGCAKTRLIGEYTEPAKERGQYSDLMDSGETIGCALRTQTGIKPVFVSIGHKISLETAREWILKLSPHYRLPETTRTADQLVNKALKESLATR